MDFDHLISDRSASLDASGIRRIFELGAKLDDPINLSIGQPDFPVDASIKAAAASAIDADHNGYTLTQGIAPLRDRIAAHLERDLGWERGDDPGLLITSGTSGAIMLAMLALLNPGDEIVIPDPHFLCYPAVATMCGATAVPCDTYPDFRLTPERVEPLLTRRTKAVLLNSPSNPAGVVLDRASCDGLRELCASRGVVLISDEIYDEFTFDDFATDTRVDGSPACPSPCRRPDAFGSTLLIRGFGKTYGMTGWRLGYAAGPKALIDQMAKLQQYTFVCAPAPLQHGVVAAFDVDMGPTVSRFKARRDLVVERLSRVTEVTIPGGAFYVFPRAPEGVTGRDFCERAIDENVLVIPGGAFSSRDTHFRISLAAPDERLERGVDILASMFATG
ncbi:MAG: pyridoxal phosphate-dependent aminotransferase [Planctomycetota bacterium]